MKRLFIAVLCLLMLVSSALATEPSKSNAELLLVAFGTSEASALTSYTAVEASFQKAGMTPVWAYTSDIIRRKMAKKGTRMFSIDEGMDTLAAKGVKTLRVQSLHIVAGEEFSQMERSVLRHLERKPGRFDEVLIGRPLLESEQDLQDVVNAVLVEFPKERTSDEAILLLAHGNSHGRGDLVLSAAREAFSERDPLVFLVTVEGSQTTDVLLADLKKKGINRVWLQPFMLVAGDHAKNDMAGPEEDSWASRLESAGIQARPHLKGLGELEGVRAVFLRHALETKDAILTLKEAE